MTEKILHVHLCWFLLACLEHPHQWMCKTLQNAKINQFYTFCPKNLLHQSL